MVGHPELGNLSRDSEPGRFVLHAACCRRIFPGSMTQRLRQTTPKPTPYLSLSELLNPLKRMEQAGGGRRSSSWLRRGRVPIHADPRDSAGMEFLDRLQGAHRSRLLQRRKDASRSSSPGGPPIRRQEHPSQQSDQVLKGPVGAAPPHLKRWKPQVFGHLPVPILAHPPIEELRVIQEEQLLGCETLRKLPRRSSISLGRSIPDTVPLMCGLHAKNSIEDAPGPEGLAHRRIAIRCQRQPYRVASARARWQPRDFQLARCAGDRICAVEAAYQAHLHQAVPCPGRRGNRGKAK